MRRKRKILKISMLCLSSIVLSGCSIFGGRSDKSATINYDSTISFSQLKDMAVSDNYTEQKNYRISGEVVDLNSGYFSVVRCLGSNLVTYSTIMGTELWNFAEDENIAENLVNLDFVYDYYRFNGYVFADSTLPIVIYKSNDNSLPTNEVYVADCYGSFLTKLQLSENAQIYRSGSKTVGDTTGFKLTFNSGNNNDNSTDYYFSYLFDGETYDVKLINKEKYENLSLLLDDNEDDLAPQYDGNGELIGYLSFSYGTINVYDSNRSFLNSVKLSSFGFEDLYQTLRLEKQICFFKNDIYYENELEKGSEDTYKSKCLIINLIDGKVSYNGNYKYYVKSCYSASDEEQFKYAFVTFYELNNKGEKDDILKCVVLKDKLNFNKPFVYDGLTTYVYNINDSAVLARYDSGYYYITNTDRTLLNDITFVAFYENGDVLFKNKNDKYCQCRLVDIVRSSKIIEGVAYMSIDKYNGKTISYDINNSTNSYFVGDKILLNNYVDLAKKGLYITKNSISIGDDTIFATTGNINISNVSVVISSGAVTLYSVRLNDGTYRYFVYECIER